MDSVANGIIDDFGHQNTLKDAITNDDRMRMANKLRNCHILENPDPL